MEQIALHAKLIVFTAYFVYITIKCGWLPSFSESYYTLKPYNQHHVFTAFCFIVAILHMVNSAQHPWYFIAGAGLIFVGVAARFKDWKTTNHVHYTGAAVSIVGSVIGLWLEGEYFSIVPILTIITVLYIFKAKNKILWVEAVAFYSIIGNQLLQTI